MHPGLHRSRLRQEHALPFVYLTLSVVSCLLVAHLINSICPYPLARQIGGTEDPSSLIVAAQLRYFEDHKDDYDVLFFGSSRTYASLQPRRFDAEMAAMGFPMRSFNFAMLAMFSHETDMTIKRVLETKPARLRWLVIELDNWIGLVDPAPKFLFLPRMVFWHDLPNTLAALRSTYLYRKPESKERSNLRAHLIQFGMHVTALGRGPQAASSLLERLGGATPYPSRLMKRLDRDQGYREPGWKIPFSKPCGAAADADQQAFYHARIKNVITNNKRSSDLEGFNITAVKEQASRLRQAGLVPVYYIPPTLRATPELFALKRQGIIEHLTAFNDPEAYRELYKEENRVDCDHLASSGAELLTAAFAKEFSYLFLGVDRPEAIESAASQPLEKESHISTKILKVNSPLLDTSVSKNAAMIADPNPISVCDGSGLGATTLMWSATGPSAIELRLGSPSGRLFGHMGPQGQATTGKWLRDGALIYLQDVSDSRPLTSQNTLAIVEISLTEDECS